MPRADDLSAGARHLVEANLVSNLSAEVFLQPLPPVGDVVARPLMVPVSTKGPNDIAEAFLGLPPGSSIVQ